jgi:hypothetical protein
MNDFIREQLEIFEAAKDHMEETLTETPGTVGFSSFIHPGFG